MVSKRMAQEEESRVEAVWRDSTEDTHESELFQESWGKLGPPEPQPTAEKGHLFVPAPWNQVEGTQTQGCHPHALLPVEHGLTLRGTHFFLGKVHLWLKWCHLHFGEKSLRSGIQGSSQATSFMYLTGSKNINPTMSGAHLSFDWKTHTA